MSPLLSVLLALVVGQVPAALEVPVLALVLVDQVGLVLATVLAGLVDLADLVWDLVGPVDQSVCQRCCRRSAEIGGQCGQTSCCRRSTTGC